MRVATQAPETTLPGIDAESEIDSSILRDTIARQASPLNREIEWLPDGLSRADRRLTELRTLRRHAIRFSWSGDAEGSRVRLREGRSRRGPMGRQRPRVTYRPPTCILSIERIGWAKGF